jgi:catechol 2,3-dioxygenase-like lactoylglutathione lyase family enzyme
VVALRRPCVPETALYVEALERAGRFYVDLFGFEPMVRDARMWALGCGDPPARRFSSGAAQRGSR